MHRLVANVFVGCVAAVALLGCLGCVGALIAAIVGLFGGSIAWFFGGLFSAVVLGAIGVGGIIGLAEFQPELKKRLSM